MIAVAPNQKKNSSPVIFRVQSHEVGSLLHAPHDAPVAGKRRKVPMTKQQLDPIVLSEPAAADMIGLAARTLQKKRLDGTGPVFVQLTGRKIGYSIQALHEWVAARSVRSTSDASVHLDQDDDGDDT